MSGGHRARRLAEAAYRLLLAWRGRPGRVRRRLAGHRLRRSPALRRIDPAAVRLAAVQLPLVLVDSPEAYVDLVVPYAREAAEQGAQLIAFPEDAATPLLGMLPGADRLRAAAGVDAALGALGEGLRVADVFAFLGPLARRVWLATFGGLARRLGVYVHAGSAVLPRGDGVYNLAALFGPDGRLLALEPKAHLLPLEAEWGLRPGDGLGVCDTLIGRIGLPVCMDATYWEAFRLLYLEGAEIAVLPTANPEDYDEWRVRRGLWARLQESPMYGVHACLVGELLGMRLTGRSGVFAPDALSPAGDGVLARVADPGAGGVAVAAADLRALHAHRRRHGPERAFNAALYARHLPELYERLLARAARAARREGRS